MKEPYKTKVIARIVNLFYDTLVLISCLVLFGLNIVCSIIYGVYSTESLLLFFPSIILIFHTLAVKVSRIDMFEKEESKGSYKVMEPIKLIPVKCEFCGGNHTAGWCMVNKSIFRNSKVFKQEEVK